MEQNRLLILHKNPLCHKEWLALHGWTSSGRKHNTRRGETCHYLRITVMAGFVSSIKQKQQTTILFLTSTDFSQITSVNSAKSKRMFFCKNESIYLNEQKRQKYFNLRFLTSIFYTYHTTLFRLSSLQFVKNGKRTTTQRWRKKF